MIVLRTLYENVSCDKSMFPKVMITILTLANERCYCQIQRNQRRSMGDDVDQSPADRTMNANRRYKCRSCIVGESHPYLCRHCVLGREDAAFSCRRCSIGTVTPQWTAADTPFNCRGCRSTGGATSATTAKSTDRFCLGSLCTDSCEAAIIKLDLFIEIDTCDEYLHNFKCGDVFRYVQLIGKACVNW